MVTLREDDIRASIAECRWQLKYVAKELQYARNAERAAETKRDFIEPFDTWSHDFERLPLLINQYETLLSYYEHLSRGEHEKAQQVGSGEIMRRKFQHWTHNIERVAGRSEPYIIASDTSIQELDEPGYVAVRVPVLDRWYVYDDYQQRINPSEVTDPKKYVNDSRGVGWTSDTTGLQWDRVRTDILEAYGTIRPELGNPYI